MSKIGFHFWFVCLLGLVLGHESSSARDNTQFVPDTEVNVTVESRPSSAIQKESTSNHLSELANRVYQEPGKSIESVVMRYGTDAAYAYHPGSAKPAILEGLGIVGDHLYSPNEWADLDSVVPRLYLAAYVGIARQYGR